MLRALAVNEFDSGGYDNLTPSGLTEGETLLTRFGFVNKGEPFGYEWVWWGFLFSLAWAVVAILGSSFFLDRVRFVTGASLVTDKGSVQEEVAAEEVEIPFQRVDLTFKDIHYTVTASTSKEKLELLKGIDGIVEAGKMTALMGSSGT